MSTSKLKAPIFIMSFDRPDYLAKVLESLRRQVGCNMDQRTIVLFQDGAVNPFSNKRYASDEAIAECVAVFKRFFPDQPVQVSPTNLGVAFNFDRAEKYAFEGLLTDAAIFLEDDLVLNEHYITVLDALIESFLYDERVGYVAAYGNLFVKSIELQHQKRHCLTLLYNNWGFAAYRRQWLKMRPRVIEYLDIVADRDYRERDGNKIRTLFASWGFDRRETSQDVAKTLACCADNVIKINTFVCNAVYIGSRGLHMTPERYEKIGFDRTIVYPQCVTEFDALDDKNYKDLLREQLKWAADTLAQEAGLATREIISGTVAPLTTSITASYTISEEIWIHALYRTLLIREPDAAGFNNGVEQLRNGDSPELVISRFLKSKEFERKIALFLKTHVKTAVLPSGALPPGLPSGALPPRMTLREQDLFVSFLRCSKQYLEFGTGGSTILAAAHVATSVTSVDSSDEWQARVAKSCAAAGTQIVPLLVWVDIGRVGPWGRPIDDSAKSRWPEYFSAVWKIPQAMGTDLCLIDGRFRVACFLSVLLHCSPLTTIMIHDFPERDIYHVVQQFADQIAIADSLAVFHRRSDFVPEAALHLLDKMKFNPD
jgi:hypothetical protein